MRIPLIVTDARLASSFGPRRGIRRICVHGAGRPATSWPASIALTPRSLAIALPMPASRVGHRPHFGCFAAWVGSQTAWIPWMGDA